jgi:hypothetical protein
MLQIARFLSGTPAKLAKNTETGAHERREQGAESLKAHGSQIAVKFNDRQKT